MPKLFWIDDFVNTPFYASDEHKFWKKMNCICTDMFDCATSILFFQKYNLMHTVSLK